MRQRSRGSTCAATRRDEPDDLARTQLASSARCLCVSELSQARRTGGRGNDAAPRLFTEGLFSCWYSGQLHGRATRLSKPTISRGCGGLGPVRGVDRHRLVVLRHRDPRARADCPNGVVRASGAKETRDLRGRQHDVLLTLRRIAFTGDTQPVRAPTDVDGHGIENQPPSRRRDEKVEHRRGQPTSVRTISARRSDATKVAYDVGATPVTRSSSRRTSATSSSTLIS